jgi:hypothetical protein
LLRNRVKRRNQHGSNKRSQQLASHGARHGASGKAKTRLRLTVPRMAFHSITWFALSITD